MKNKNQQRHSFESVKSAWKKRHADSAPELSSSWLRGALAEIYESQRESEISLSDYLLGAALSALASVLVFFFASSLQAHTIQNDVELAALMNTDSVSFLIGDQQL